MCVCVVVFVFCFFSCHLFIRLTFIGEQLLTLSLTKQGSLCTSAEKPMLPYREQASFSAVCCQWAGISGCGCFCKENQPTFCTSFYLNALGL